MTELSSQARQLVEAAKRQGGLASGRRARLTSAVLAGTVAGTATGTTSAAGGVSIVKLVMAGVISAAIGAGGTYAVSTSTRVERKAQGTQIIAAPQAPIARPAPTAEARVETEKFPMPAAEESPKPPSPTARLSAAPVQGLPHRETPSAVQDEELTPSIPPSVHRVPEDSTSEEIHALAAAAEAIKKRDFALAYHTSRTALLKYPRGVLHPEFTAVEVDALCGLDKREDAKAVAASLTNEERTPLILDRLRRSCAAEEAR